MSDKTDFAKAYQTVGEYFCAFSELDRELGEAVKVVLALTCVPQAISSLRRSWTLKEG